MNREVFLNIPDKEFVRGDVPMTKEDVRTLSLAKLRLFKDSKIVDIGAGTGSVSITASMIASEGVVYAVEKNSEAIDLLGKNIEKFGQNNIEVISGIAPEALNGVKDFDRVFIGGSSGKLAEIFQFVHERLPAGGIIVVNSISLETISMANEFFKMNEYEFEIIQALISKVEKRGQFSMLFANNPVFIISGKKV